MRVKIPRPPTAIGRAPVDNRSRGEGEKGRRGENLFSTLVKIRVFETTDAVLQQGHIEIDQQSYGKTSQLQVVDHLGTMDGRQRLHRLCFDEHRTSRL